MTVALDPSVVHGDRDRDERDVQEVAVDPLTGGDVRDGAEVHDE